MEQAQRATQRAQIMAQVHRRLLVASAWGTHQTIKDVARVVFGEWRDWMTKQHPDIWSSHSADWKDVQQKLIDRMVLTVNESKDFRDKLLENDGRDTMRGYMLRWTCDEIEKVAPAVLTDRLLPRYMTGA